MQFRDAFLSAVSSLQSNRTRGFLTMLGIIIGIASTIVLMSLGSSAQILILDQIKGVGSNLVYIIPGAPTNVGVAPSTFGIVIKTLVERDMESLRREPCVLAAVPVVRGQGRLVAGSKDKAVTWQASTAEFFSVNNLAIGSGRAFSNEDVQSFNRLVVLGSDIASDLFGSKDPVGERVRLKDMSFRVVGVLAPKGVGALGIDQDRTAIIPMTVGQKQFLGISHYQFVAVQIDERYETAFAKERIASVLRQNHAIRESTKDDFILRAQEDALSILGNVTSALTAFLTAIAAISLIVGGVGVMNIMFVSIIERTKEIGLRKAIGARESDIQLQFLVEAVLLTSIGGSIGILVGVAITGAAAIAISTYASLAWTFTVPLSAVLLAVTVSVATGIVFGVYPARHAARLDPIEALRYE